MAHHHHAVATITLMRSPQPSSTKRTLSDRGDDPYLDDDDINNNNEEGPSPRKKGRRINDQHVDDDNAAVISTALLPNTPSRHHHHHHQQVPLKMAKISPIRTPFAARSSLEADSVVLVQSPIQCQSRRQASSNSSSTSSSPSSSSQLAHYHYNNTSTLSTSSSSPPRTLQQVAERLRQSIIEGGQQQPKLPQGQNVKQLPPPPQPIRKNPRTPPSTPLQWMKLSWLDPDNHNNNTQPPRLLSPPAFPTTMEDDDDHCYHKKSLSPRMTFHMEQRGTEATDATITTPLAPIAAAATAATTRTTTSRRGWCFMMLAFAGIGVGLASAAASSFWSTNSVSRRQQRRQQQQQGQSSSRRRMPPLPLPIVTNHTVRSLLTHPDGFSLAMAPAFFGFYGYFGALAAWEESFAPLTTIAMNSNSNKNNPTKAWYLQHVKSVAGASAGAMAAILLAAGISPQDAIAFCSNVTLDQFADFPGAASVFRGDKFERIMSNFISQHGQTRQQQQQQQYPSTTTTKRTSTMRLENSIIPVAVSAFDLQTFQGQILTRGSMAKAARASATFPFLFQPVAWREGPDQDYLLLDGGIFDAAGLQGLTALPSSFLSSRLIVNMVVGDFMSGTPPGPRALFPHTVVVDKNSDDDDDATPTVLSIAIRNLPSCGPWAMQNGPKAIEAARQAMLASLDTPLVQIAERHLSLRIDAGKFVPKA